MIYPQPKLAPLTPAQWYNDNTYYQILLFEREIDEHQKPSWKTKLITKTRGDFQSYKLDRPTQNRIKEQYKANEVKNSPEDYTTIGSTLPTSGSVFNKYFINALFNKANSGSEVTTEVNNFYEVFRTLLHTRQMSQLIAKTWHAQLQAQKLPETPNDSDFLERAIQYNKSLKNSDNKDSIDIIDGLLTRSAFLFADSYEPDELDPPNLDIYYPLTSQSEPEKDARFLILPSSKGWQSLGLSLVMAGQAYYPADEDGNILNKKEVEEAEKEGKVRYHQISKSILSTGEIVIKYALDVSFNIYKGDIQELNVGSNQSSPAYLAILPYPAIPSEINVSPKQIESWANASATEGEFPFYRIKEDGQYLVGVQNFSPPNPYLPSSCC